MCILFDILPTEKPMYILVFLFSDRQLQSIKTITGVLVSSKMSDNYICEYPMSESLFNSTKSQDPLYFFINDIIPSRMMIYLPSSESLGTLSVRVIYQRLPTARRFFIITIELFIIHTSVSVQRSQESAFAHDT